MVSSDAMEAICHGPRDTCRQNEGRTDTDNEWEVIV